MDIKSGVKNITKDLLYRLGICKSLLWFSSIYKYPKLAILVYHRSCASGENCGYMGIPLDAFEQHMKFIKNNFKIVSIEEGLENLYEKNGREIYVAINFDDGYMDNYLYAYPVLKKYGLPATIFLTTDYIGKTPIFWWDRVFNIVSSKKLNDIKINIGSEAFSFNLDGALQREQVTDYINGILRTKNEDQIQSIIANLEESYSSLKKAKPSPMLGWEEIMQMKRNGINFGSHTKTHRNLCLLKDNEAREELVGSKKEIEEKLGEEVSEFSYPFDIFDERIKNLAREAGFGCAIAGLKRFNHKDTDRFLLASICAGSLLKTSFLANRISLSLFKTH